jgi:tRNA G10  N-methylase Trm11
MPDIEGGPIIFFDIEPGLKKPPDVICDLRQLPVRSKLNASIVADPPYWNFGTSDLHGDPQEAKGSWWGNFKNLRNLRSILVGIMKSSRRVLRPGGRLYLKWCDVVYPWTRFAPMFSWDFELEEKEERRSKSGRNVKPCYWFTYSLKE